MTVPTLQLHIIATVELDSQTIKSVPICDLSLGGVMIDLHGEFYTDDRHHEDAGHDANSGELAHSDKNIYCMKFSDPNITSTATLEGVIDEIVANGGGGGALGVENIT